MVCLTTPDTRDSSAREWQPPLFLASVLEDLIRLRPVQRLLSQIQIRHPLQTLNLREDDLVVLGNPTTRHQHPQALQI